MELATNAFKTAIRAGRPQIGIWSSLCSYISAEVLADAGFDWVLLDTEHSPNELPMVQNQLDSIAFGKGTTEPIVRPAWNDIVLMKRIRKAGKHPAFSWERPTAGAVSKWVMSSSRSAANLVMLARGADALAARFRQA